MEGNFAVERKTLRDFAASVVDTRLFKQVARLAQNGRRGILILEGTASAAGDAGISREAFQGAHSERVLRAGGAAFARRIRDRAPFSLPRSAGPTLRTRRSAAARLPAKGETSAADVLQGLPGIGPGRAEKLLERFGSVVSVAQASLSELSEVEGVGENIATKIRWALEESGSWFEP